MWTITISDDADSTGEKTITGLWAGKDGEYSFSMRGTPDVKGQDAFIEAAVRARDAWQNKKTAENEFVAACLSKLNTVDAVEIAKAVI
jgi:hypothetical protein